MRKVRAFFCVYLFCSLFVPLKAEDTKDITIRVNFFQGEQLQDPAHKAQAPLTSPDIVPEISALLQQSQITPNEFQAALFKALMDVYALRSMEDLFSHVRSWNRRLPLLDDVVLGKEIAYRLKLYPKNLSDDRISVRIVISKTREGIVRPASNRSEELSDAYRATRNDAQMEGIIDRSVEVGIGRPAILCVSGTSRISFLVISLTPGNAMDSTQPKEPKKKDEIYFVAEPPNPTFQIQPAYPEALRQQRIGGEIGLRIRINEKGAVTRVEVEKPLHPYLNYAAVQAFRQWIFEPVRREKKLTPAEFRYTYNFNLWMGRYEEVWGRTETASSSQRPQTDLPKLLAGAGDYCLNLEKASLFFICEETIEETHYDLLHNIDWGMLLLWDKPLTNGGWTIGGKRIQIMDPKLTKRNRYLCDYQIVRDLGKLKEQRIILKKNGVKPDQQTLLEDSRFSALSSLFAAQDILLPERQSLYYFKIIDDDRFHGKSAYVVEAIPKGEGADWIWLAKIWIDKKSFQILKSEISGIPIGGYEDVLNDCTYLNIRPTFVSSYEYRNEKGGLCYPSLTKIHVEYPGIDYFGPVTKLIVELSDDNFKFFEVSTESQIIK